MSLEDFKTIFFWEWLHRLWGRMIGMIYALPLLWFWARRQLPAGYGGSFLLILVLGFLQGAMGWYMVQSGLVDRPSVSHYRLAAHLMLAFLIFALTLRLALKLHLPARTPGLEPARPLIFASLGLAVLTMTWGAFVAGMDAGRIYNSFPMMGDYPWPSEIVALAPWWLNPFENHATVQFIHRALALLTTAHVIGLWVKGRRLATLPRQKAVFAALGLAVLLQAGLGIATLLSHINITLATLHQGGAMILIALLVWAELESRPQTERTKA